MMKSGLVLYAFMVGMACVLGQVEKKDVSYGVVIDLGSKGSRVSIFTWPSDSKTPYAEVEFGGGKNPWYSKITPGVATFANNPVGAGPYLKPLLEYASIQVPMEQHKLTPIFIRGTDNLRQLPGNQAAQIMASLSNYTASHFNFLMTPNCVALLPGILEGGFMWVAANYLMGNFQAEKTPIGTLDMGSGSTQIAFVPKSGTFIPTSYYYLFTYLKDNYSPYVHSYSGYGYIASLYAVNSSVLQQASSGAETVYNPCFLSGYSSSMIHDDRTVVMQGTGSWSQCSQLIKAFLNTSAPCNYTPCSFDGAFMPPLKGDFVAVSNFVDVESILGFSSTASVQDLIDGGIKFCALSWEEAQQKFPEEDPSDLYSFCFGANYISNLLSVGYGFPLDAEINFSKTYDNAPFTWALGAMIYELQMGW